MSATTSTPSPTTPAVSEASGAQRAARGGAAVLGAKVFFILSGFVQNVALPALIGQEAFGALSRVLAAASVVNNVMVASATQGVSRMVARAREHQGEALRLGLRVHGIIALAAGALFACAAPAVGAFEHAPYIVAPLATMAGVATCYGFYAALVGALNGRALFGKQAALDVTFAVMRTAGILGLGWLFWRRGGSGELGAAIGFVCAAILIIPLALRWAGTGKPHRVDAGPMPDVPPARTYLAALVPLAVAQLFTNAVMQIDISLLARFLTERAPDAKTADEWVAVYRECQLFAFLPYQLLFSVTQVLFPYVARAHGAGDAKLVAEYVARGARIGALACGMLVAIVASMPESLLRFAYSADVAARGAGTLRLLALGQGAFAMMAIGATVLVSLGREREAAGITFVTLVAIAGGCFAVVPGRPFGAAQNQAAALATTCAMALGVAITAWRVRGVAGAFVPWKTATRAAGALAAAVVAGLFVPPIPAHGVGRLLAPLEAAVVAGVYLVALVASRELGGEDARLMRGIARARARERARLP